MEHIKKISSAMYDALRLKYEAQRAEARTTLLVYFNNPVGIGEHPQHLEEMDKLMANMVDAQDKLDMLTNAFSEYNCTPVVRD
jgi:hypothetical protein